MAAINNHTPVTPLAKINNAPGMMQKIKATNKSMYVTQPQIVGVDSRPALLFGTLLLSTISFPPS
jgi:hypothetical protein